jgi:formylglycine-generating enzyme
MTKSEGRMTNKKMRGGYGDPPREVLGTGGQAASGTRFAKLCHCRLPFDSSFGFRISSLGAVLLLTLTGCTSSSPVAPQPKTVTTKSGITMVAVPAGRCQLGSDSGAADEAPPRMIWIDAFMMDATEVTQAQYTALAVVNPSHYKGDDRPVEQVSWAKAALYCNMRSKAEGLDPCYDEETAACNFKASGYRLPTEAEWEWACRAGPAAPARPPLADEAWLAENSGKTTHPVRQKQPNAWGLYDMLGNVAEWCNDVYDPAYYKMRPDTNPRGPAEGKLRVLRGGAWNSKPEACRPAARLGEYPGFADACFARDAIGFRCVRKPGPGE